MAVEFLQDVNLFRRLDVSSDIRVRGNTASANLGVARMYVDGSNNFYVDPGNVGTALTKFEPTGRLTLTEYTTTGGFTGTATKMLATTATGIVVQEPLIGTSVAASTANDELGIVVSGTTTANVGIDITGRTENSILGMQDTDMMLIYDASAATNLKVAISTLAGYIKYTGGNFERSKHLSLTSVTTGITRTVASGYTTFELTPSTWFPYYNEEEAFMVQVVDNVSSQSLLGQIVGAEVDLNTGTADRISIKFKGTVANDDYKVNLHFTGTMTIPE